MIIQDKFKVILIRVKHLPGLLQTHLIAACIVHSIDNFAFPLSLITTSTIAIIPDFLLPSCFYCSNAALLIILPSMTIFCFRFDLLLLPHCYHSWLSLAILRRLILLSFLTPPSNTITTLTTMTTLTLLP